MRTRFSATTLLAAALLFLCGAAHADGIRWGKSLTAATQTARAQKKAIIIDLWADWCGYCKKLEAEVFPDPRFIKVANQMVPLRLDADREGRALMQRYRVQGLPCTLIIDADGYEIGRIQGYAPAEPFVKQINAYLQFWRDLPGLESRLASGTTDPTMLTKLMVIYTKQGRMPKALKTLAIWEKKGKVPAAAYISVGDMLREKGEFATAIGQYSKGFQRATTSGEKAYTNIAIGFSHAGAGNAAEAIKALEKARAVPGCPGELSQMASQAIMRLRGGGN